MHGPKPTTTPRHGERNRLGFLRRFWPFGRREKVAVVSEELSSDVVRVARAIRLSGRKILGLVPASKGTPTAELSRDLSAALVKLYGARVAWVDLDATYKAEIEADDAGAIDDDGLFATRWLKPELLWISPHSPGETGTRFQLVELVVAHLRATHQEPFEHILVDLTGFHRLGELLETSTHLQGVIIVGAAGRTTTNELLHLADALPADQNLGVLLTR